MNITSISGNKLLILASSWHKANLYFNFNHTFPSNQTIAQLYLYAIIEAVNRVTPCPLGFMQNIGGLDWMLCPNPDPAGAYYIILQSSPLAATINLQPILAHYVSAGYLNPFEKLNFYGLLLSSGYVVTYSATFANAVPATRTITLAG